MNDVKATEGPVTPVEEQDKIYALVKRGICTNTIVAKPSYAATIQGYDAVVDCNGRASYGVGLFWSGTEFMSVEEAIKKRLL